MRFHEDALDLLECSDGVFRNVHIWKPKSPRAVFVGVHGGLAHGGDFCTPALFLKERGFATVSFDQHGHGRQEKVFVPRFEVFLDDLEVFLRWTKDRFHNLPLILLGHSMGALILTHFGLRRSAADDDLIRGYVLSSPYYRNLIKAPRALLWLSHLLSAVVPRMTVPVDDFTSVLTHDPEITRRHREDAADHLRATRVSARFARELLDAQAFVPESIARWRFPMLMLIAGEDHLADSHESQRLARLIDSRWVTLRCYPHHYHENLNEIGREEVFIEIEKWVESRLPRAEWGK